ncbi:MAG TPA: TylF/MycF/NovP-related O-methyltransferase [Pseudolabrys sp.]|nr:TylF/MycF/NovP-related O-methyltransferase [Pseudolabrys sp.]
MKKNISGLLDVFFKGKTRERINEIAIMLRGGPYGFLADPSYSEDGLVTFHLAEFMKDPKFMKAYAAGKRTGALRKHPGDIHWRAYVACWAASRAKHLAGDFVECGVGRGLLSRTIVEYLDFNGLDKKFWLFDTYSGIPDGVLSEEERRRGIRNELFGYDDSYSAVKETFSGFSNVQIVQGIVPESLAGQPIDRVSYLSIDMNNAASEIAAISFFWDKLVAGAVVVLDDYAYSPAFLAQHKAFNEFCSSKGVCVLALPTGQGLIIKP